MYALKDAAGNPTNYIKVRDLALMLIGSKAMFGVEWNGAVNLAPGAFYFPDGSELSTPFTGERAYTVPTTPTNVNGVPSDLQAIVLTDDAGGAYTYYQLRDLGKKLGFNVAGAGSGAYSSSLTSLTAETENTRGKGDLLRRSRSHLKMNRCSSTLDTPSR